MIWKLFLVFIGATLLLNTSCQNNPTASSKILHLNLKQDMATLDPRCARYLLDLTLMTQLYEGLMRLDSEGQPQPALAKEVNISENKLTYTFSLREAFWSDGSKITAFDFENSWKKVLDPQFQTDYAHMLFVIKNGKKAKTKLCSLDEIGVCALNDETLEVTLEKPTPFFLSLTTLPITFPIKKELDEKNPHWMLSEKTMLSCGPFQISKWDRNYVLELTKNNRYWDESHVKLNQIMFTLIADSTTESYLFEKGELDWVGQPLSKEISSEFLKQLKDEQRVCSYDVLGTYMLKFQTENAPMNDCRIRKAFALASCRDKIVTHLLQGNQKIALSFLPPSLHVHEKPYFKDEDTTQAISLFEEYLKENHLTREKFPKIIISYPLSERNSKIVQLLQENWQKTFGIHIELEGTEMQCYRQKLKAGQFQIATGDWIADYPDPLSFLEIFQTRPQASLNDTRWNNATYNDLLEKAINETNSSLRRNYYREAEEILMEEMPISPLYHYCFDYAKNKQIENVLLSPLGIADYKYADIVQR